MFVNTRAYPFSRTTLTSRGLTLMGNNTKMCLEFWYHMHGASVNDLDVIIREYRGPSRVVWMRRGTQGDTWLRAEVNLENAKNQMQVNCNGLGQVTE